MHNQQQGEEGIMANPGVSGTSTASEKVSMGDRLDCRRMRLLFSMQAMNLLPSAIFLLEPRFLYLASSNDGMDHGRQEETKAIRATCQN